jgi:hypothetical protein
VQQDLVEPAHFGIDMKPHPCSIPASPDVTPAELWLVAPGTVCRDQRPLRPVP